MEGYLDVKLQGNASEMCFGWIPAPSAPVKRQVSSLKALDITVFFS